MAIAYINLEDTVTAVLGENHDPRFDRASIINEAGRYLFSMHDWQWKHRPPTFLSFVNGQTWLALPADFGELRSIKMTNSMIRSITPTTVDDIMTRRSLPIYYPFNFFVAVVYPTQTATSSAPAAPRLEVWPTPGSSEANAIQFDYDAAWIELSAAAPAAIANVPARFESLLVQIVRAKAKQYQDGSNDLMNNLEKSAELQRLKEHDGLAVGSLGQTTGGILQKVAYPFRPYKTVPNWTQY